MKEDVVRVFVNDKVVMTDEEKARKATYCRIMIDFKFTRYI